MSSGRRRDSGKGREVMSGNWCRDFEACHQPVLHFLHGTSSFLTTNILAGLLMRPEKD